MELFICGSNILDGLGWAARMWIFRAIIARPRLTIGRKMLQKYIVAIHTHLLPHKD